MSARKLSDADKQAILQEYRQPGETTLTIANRYGVSNSTISRMLKSSLSPKDYEALIQQKRSAKWADTSLPEPTLEPEPIPEPSVESISLPEPQFSPSDPSRRIRKRSSATQLPDIQPLDIQPPDIQPPDIQPPDIQPPDIQPPDSKESVQLDLQFADVEKPSMPKIINVNRLSDSLPTPSEDLEDEDLEDEDFEEDEDLEDFDEEEDGDDESDSDFSLHRRGTRIVGQLRVLPFDVASLPKTCYIVVDRTAELITRPLKDFGDLGQIPPEEIQEKTLPVFDNHRVARRFANRSQRVTKVPDGKMLQRVKDYLQAKGITRILVDGQVYSL